MKGVHIFRAGEYISNFSDPFYAGLLPGRPFFAPHPPHRPSPFRPGSGTIGLYSEEEEHGATVLYRRERGRQDDGNDEGNDPAVDGAARTAVLCDCAGAGDDGDAAEACQPSSEEMHPESGGHVAEPARLPGVR